jgi:N utilization substance protein B
VTKPANDKPAHPAERLRARSRARRCALQALYQWQLNGDSAADLLRQYREGDELKKADQEFFQALVIGCVRDGAALIASVAGLLDRPIEQLDPIERAALTIGLFELRHELDVPYRVVISEAVALAKDFGGADGHKYVNAVLDRAAAQLRAHEHGGAR